MNSESDSTCTDSSGEPSPHSPLTWILSASVRDEKPRTTWLHSLAWQAQTLWKESKQWHHNVRTMLALRLAHGLTCHRNAALFDHVVLLRFEDDPVIVSMTWVFNSAGIDPGFGWSCGSGGSRCGGLHRRPLLVDAINATEICRCCRLRNFWRHLSSNPTPYEFRRKPVYGRLHPVPPGLERMARTHVYFDRIHVR